MGTFYRDCGSNNSIPLGYTLGILGSYLMIDHTENCVAAAAVAAAADHAVAVC